MTSSSRTLVTMTVRLMCGVATEFRLLPITVTFVPPLEMYKHHDQYVTEYVPRNI